MAACQQKARRTTVTTAFWLETTEWLMNAHDCSAAKGAEAMAFHRKAGRVHMLVRWRTEAPNF
jgi:hypothetical protein